MLEIRSILEGDKGFNSPVLQDFARYIAQRLPDKFESAEPMAQATEVVNDIMFASFDVKNNAPSLAENYPDLYNYLLASGDSKVDMQSLCRDVADVLIDRSHFLFSAALAAIKPTYFG